MSKKVWMLFALIGAIFEIHSSARAAVAAPNLSDFARDSKGVIQFMTQLAAIDYCDRRKERLPTARELALYSQSLGAEGVSEIIKSGSYILVDSTDNSNYPDTFYFSASGYQRPSGDAGANQFWSSSTEGDNFSPLGFFLDGHNGFLYTGLRGTIANNPNLQIAVRCASSPVDN